MTMPNPTMSINTVRNRTSSGERFGAIAEQVRCRARPQLQCCADVGALPVVIVLALGLLLEPARQKSASVSMSAITSAAG